LIRKVVRLRPDGALAAGLIWLIALGVLVWVGVLLVMWAACLAAAQGDRAACTERRPEGPGTVGRP
jgi:hypothetical protein